MRFCMPAEMTWIHGWACKETSVQTAGTILFGIFRSRTSAYYFSQDLKHGGAAYIPTGRGYALKHATFVKTYTSYGRSHIYYAVTVRWKLVTGCRQL